MAEENNEFNEDLFGVDLSNMEEMVSFMDQQTTETEEEELPDVTAEAEEESNETSEQENNDIESSETTETEETEESTEETTEENQEDPSSQNTDDSSPLTPYAKLLVEEGLLPNSFDFEKWDGTAEGLLEAKRQQDLAQFEEYKKGNLDPRVKWLQDNLEQGVKLEELLAMDAERLDLNDITEEKIEENDTIAKNVAKMFFKKTSKWSDAMIDKSIERLESVGELKEESKGFFKQLNEILNQEEQDKVIAAAAERKAAEKQADEAMNNFKTTLEQTDEVISGLKITPVLKDKIFNALTIPTKTMDDGMELNRITEARMEDPVGFDIKLAYLFELTDGFNDWSAISKGGRRQAYDEFEKQARAADIKTTNSGKQVKRSTNRQQQNADDIIKELEFISKNMGQ